MTDCIFCNIIAGTIPSAPLYTSAQVIAIPDLHPQAPVHVLILPKRHIPTFNALAATDGPLWVEMTQAIHAVARLHGIAERGYRLIVNTNADGGQEVFHLHVHLLGGAPLGPQICA